MIEDYRYQSSTGKCFTRVSVSVRVWQLDKAFAHLLVGLRLQHSVHLSSAILYSLSFMHTTYPLPFTSLAALTPFGCFLPRELAIEHPCVYMVASEYKYCTFLAR